MELLIVKGGGIFDVYELEAPAEDAAAEEELRLLEFLEEELLPPFDVGPGEAEASDDDEESADEVPPPLLVEPLQPHRGLIDVPLIRILIVIGLILLVVSLGIPRYIPPSRHSLYPVKAGYR